MKTYLSRNPVWLKPTATIRALDSKSIVIIEGHHRTAAYIRVSEADQKSRYSGLCHVEIWQASIDPMNVKWTDTGSRPSTAQAHQWKMYLAEDALSLIHPNQEDQEYGELLLEIPTEGQR